MALGVPACLLQKRTICIAGNLPSGRAVKMASPLRIPDNVSTYYFAVTESSNLRGHDMGSVRPVYRPRGLTAANQ